MELISAYPYAYRSPTPTAVSLSVSDDVHLRGQGTAKFYDRAGKFPRSERLEARIKEQWGTVRYEDPVAFVREDKYVGIMREEGIAAAETVDHLVDALRAEKGGIDELTVRANKNGYRAILKTGSTIVNIEYDGETLTAHQYKSGRYDPGIVRSQVMRVRASEPKRDKYLTTDDLGVCVSGTDNLVVSVTSKRKKQGMYNPPTSSNPNKRVTTGVGAEEFIKQEFVYNLSASFATAEEMKRMEQGEQMQFTLQFKGYRRADAANKEQDDALREAYREGMSTGIKGILRKLERVYTGRQREIEEPLRITEQERFTEVFMKAKATPRQFVDQYGHAINQPIPKIIIDKEHRMYLVAARRLLGRKPKHGEGVVLQETIVYPTVASLEAREQEYLKERTARETQEAAVPKENIQSWSQADIVNAPNFRKSLLCVH